MYNIAIIGCGYWSKNIVRNLIKIKNVKIKYLCDKDQPSSKFFKKSFNLINSEIIQDYKKVNNVDACFVITPIKTHFEIIKFFINKCHLFVEKPLCYRKNELNYILTQSKKSKYMIMTGHIYLYNKNIEKINHIRKKHHSGEVLTIYSTRTNLGRIQSDINSLWSFAPHDITIMYRILKKFPTHVSCIGFNLINKKLEDMVYIILHFKNIKVSFQLGWYHPNKIRETIIICKNKIIVYDDVNLTHSCKIIDTKVENLNEYDLLKTENINNFKFNIIQGKTKIFKKSKEEPLLNELKFFFNNLNNSIARKKELNLSSSFLSIMLSAQKSLDSNGKKIKINYV